jgi:hypothetical protein
MDFSAPDPKFGVSAKVVEAPLEILRDEAQVTIELYDKVPFLALNRIIAVIKRFHHTATGLPISSVPAVYDVNP